MASLAGQRVVVTRAAPQAAELVSLLEASGADVIRYPVIAIAPPEDEGLALRRALNDIEHYDWIIFTSANAVERLPAHQDFGDAGIAAIGDHTARALAARGIAVDVVPDRADSEALVEALVSRYEVTGEAFRERALLLRAAEGRDALPVGLRGEGWVVDDVAVYRTVRAAPTFTLASDDFDVVTFTSPSTVQHFVALTGVTSGVAVCLGRPTAEAASNAGFTVTTADEATMASMVDAVHRAIA